MQRQLEHTPRGAVRISERRAFRFAVPFTVIVTLGAHGFVRLVGGNTAISMDLWDPLIAVILLSILLLLHECLHALGHLVWGRAAPSTIKVGFDWSHFRPYCAFQMPTRISVFRIVLILPLLGTLLVCAPLLCYVSTGWTALVTGVAIGSCATDLQTLLAIRGFDADDIVTEHPDGGLAYLILSEPTPDASTSR